MRISVSAFYSFRFSHSFFLRFKRIRNKTPKLVKKYIDLRLNSMWCEWVTMCVCVGMIHAKAFVCTPWHWRNDEAKWDVINSIIYYWIIRDEFSAHAHAALFRDCFLRQMNRVYASNILFFFGVSLAHSESRKWRIKWTQKDVGNAYVSTLALDSSP